MKRPDLKKFQSTATIRWPVLSYGMLPLTIILITILVCLIAYTLVTASLDVSRGKSINRTFHENELRLDSVVDSSVHLIWGSTARIQSGDIDEGQWQNFVSVYNLPKNFKAVEAVGVAYGSSPQDMTIAYVSPQTDSTTKVIGTNIGTLSQLSAIMNIAIEDNRTTISDTLPNLFSTKSDIKSQHPGFLAFAPIYDTSKPLSTADERKSALRGFSIALFRGDIFFEKVLQDFDASHAEVHVYLGKQDPANLLYTKGQTTTSNVVHKTQEIGEYGKTFTITYAIDRDSILSWWLTYFPQILIVSGLFLGMLFAGLSGYMLRSRYRWLIYEKERDVAFAKDELLSLASHQLRTPATGVKQYLGMVLQGFAGKVPAKQLPYLERAYASNDRQLGVINDILHLAKLESGRIVLAKREFALAQMIREVIDEQQNDATEGEVALTLDAPSRTKIVADPHMLQMVIENLISNAIKYTPPKGKVSVRLVRRGAWWVLSVKDNGVGIAKSDLSKLFKQFSRINNPRSEFVTGTGIGLYLAYHLTVLHGGTITVTSMKSRGSTFIVRVPRNVK